MSAELSPENSRFLQEQVASGEFAAGGDALNAAVDLLKRQAEVRAKIKRGLDQLDNGQYIELDDEGLDRYFEDLLAIACGERPLK